MAIIQISQITQRKGLSTDLPNPLAGGEFGWSMDTRQLWIGNGTLVEGAPVVGNTEILTQFSDIFALANQYTYAGAAGGYVVQTGPTPSDPVQLSLQSWMDQWASVKDFGAKGDGVTDDTDAINRALNQLYCRAANPQVRRALFFPAGVYVVSSTINIPTYAMLYGEGVDSSIIQLADIPFADQDDTNRYVARTADSLQQTGPNIGNGGARPPAFITVANLAFENLTPDTDVFLFEDASECRFTNVGFYGPLNSSQLLDNVSFTSKGIEFASTDVLICQSISIDGCDFSGTTYGVYSTDNAKGVSVTNSNFNLHYQGVYAGSVLGGTGPAGLRITNNNFFEIFAEGVVFNEVSNNATGYNTFFDVGNNFTPGAPTTSIISIFNGNNVSIGDMFQRSDAQNAIVPRISITGTGTSLATSNGTEFIQGTLVTESGIYQQLVANTVGEPLFTFDNTTNKSFVVNYTLTRGTTVSRTGSFVVTSFSSTGTSDPVTSDDYSESVILNAASGVTLTATRVDNIITVRYDTTVGENGIINYTISYFNQ